MSATGPVRSGKGSRWEEPKMKRPEATPKASTGQKTARPTRALTFYAAIDYAEQQDPYRLSVHGPDRGLAALPP